MLSIGIKGEHLLEKMMDINLFVDVINFYEVATEEEKKILFGQKKKKKDVLNSENCNYDG